MKKSRHFEKKSLKSLVWYPSFRHLTSQTWWNQKYRPLKVWIKTVGYGEWSDCSLFEFNRIVISIDRCTIHLWNRCVPLLCGPWQMRSSLPWTTRAHTHTYTCAFVFSRLRENRTVTTDTRRNSHESVRKWAHTINLQHFPNSTAVAQKELMNFKNYYCFDNT